MPPDELDGLPELGIPPEELDEPPELGLPPDGLEDPPEDPPPDEPPEDELGVLGEGLLGDGGGVVQAATTNPHAIRKASRAECLIMAYLAILCLRVRHLTRVGFTRRSATNG